MESEVPVAEIVQFPDDNEKIPPFVPSSPQRERPKGGPDQIAYYGGRVCDCNDTLCYSCCFPGCAYAEAVADADEGAWLTECLLFHFVPCYFPFWFVVILLCTLLT